MDTNRYFSLAMQGVKIVLKLWVLAGMLEGCSVMNMKQSITKHWKAVRYDMGMDITKLSEPNRLAMQQFYDLIAQRGFLHLEPDGKMEYRFGELTHKGTWRLEEATNELVLLPDGLSAQKYTIEVLNRDELVLTRKKQYLERITLKAEN
jgi:hypothetical protein